MTRIPLINPKLVNVVTSSAERTPAPVLRAEVVSSEAIKTPTDQPASQRANSSENKSGPDNKAAADNKDIADNKSAANEQRYKVVLRIGNQKLETISTEDLKKGSQLEVKVMPGPELKIITANDKTQPPAHSSPQPSSQPATQAALQQLLADRIPKIQSQGLAKLIDQLSQLVSATKSTTTTNTLVSNAINNPIAAKAESLLANISTMDPSITAKTDAKTQTTKQALANLAYQSLANQSLTKHPSKHQGTISTAATSDIRPSQSSTPIEQVKNWLQQLPSTSDISNSTGLRNALNNTGVRAETQLSQLAQQFAILSKGTQSSNEEKSANSIFQQLQKIQQKMFSKNPEPLSKTDLGSIVKSTAQSLEKNSQAILTNLKTGTLNTKTGAKTDSPASILAANQTAAQPTALTPSLLNASSPPQAANNWQNPLLNNPAYSTLNELLKDPLLQNPSSNNKFALSQILHHSANQADSTIRIPLNWPERSGNDATFLRTIQNLLGHIEREQSIQLQQSDSNTTNNPNLTPPQNQQWLPLLIHHHQQLQLIEFFINKEEKTNTQGEKKSHWFINLHFDLPQLGELGIEISMFENECNTTFWSESSSTLSQLSQHVQPLRERLTEQGIIVSDVQSRHGTLSKRKHNFEQRLVDIET